MRARYAGMRNVVFVFGLTLLVAPGCALFRPNSSGEREVVRVNSPDPETEAATEATKVDAAGSSAPVGPSKAGEILLKKSNLGRYASITVELPAAEITIAGTTSRRKGSIQVQLIEGDSACQVYLHEQADSLRVTDRNPEIPAPTAVSAMRKVARSYLPNDFRCRYSVEMALRDSADLDIDLRRGAVAVEDWMQPIRVRMEWGEINVGSVRQLDVDCKRCTLAGIDVAGPLQFALEAGNVGLDGLTSSVTGNTRGDVILKWRRTRSNTKINVLTKAGDVILSLPRTSPLEMKLEAPRGDIYTPRRRSVSHGIPVQAMAEAGNVRIYPSR